ncbi:MAG: hypothetical protein ACRDKH_06395 [Solirubrobacterales bacterium]
MAGGLVSRFRGSTVQLQAIAFVAIELWKNGRDRVQRNLRDRERAEFLDLIRQFRGKPSNLDQRERRRFAHLVRKAATGDGDSDWVEVAKTLPTLLPPAAIADLWSRNRGRRR